MTRIVCLTDTHIGCGEAGFKRQPRYLAEVDTLFEALGRWLDQMQVDLLVHAGDVTDRGTRPEIAQAIKRFTSLDVPMAVALGNHDLCELDSMTWWREAANEMVAGGRHEVLHVGLKHCDVLLLTHHWRPGQPYHWLPDEPQQPRVDEQQEAELCAQLVKCNRPTILVSHAPAHAIPPAQTGLDEPIHVPHPPYLESLRRVAQACPNLRLVLSGHNHTHSVHCEDSFVSCSTTALNERPAELRLIDVDDEVIAVRTMSLAQEADLPNALAPDQAWSAGGSAERSFTVPVAASQSTGSATDASD